MGEGTSEAGQARPDRSGPHILVIATAFEPAVKAGGPVRAITNLVDEVAERATVYVVAPDRDLGDDRAFKELGRRAIRRGNVTVSYVNTRNILHLTRRLISVCNSADMDVILINSLWNRPMALVPSLLINLHLLRARAVVLMPRGEIEAAAIRHHSRRKALLFPLVRGLHNRAVDVFAATSESEVRNIQSRFGKQVLLCSDQADVFDFGQPVDLRRRPHILFVGRIVAHKGLLPLIRSLSLATPGMQLDVAGPIEDAGYWERCVAEAERNAGRFTVNYLGVASRQQLPRLMRDHDVLVSLTAGENFGHTFAEAMQAGCPVLATRETPWTEVLLAGGGWVVTDRDDYGAIAQILSDIANTTPDQRLNQRRAARGAFESWFVRQPPNVIEQVLEILN